jgi:steroid delta-isomerase-like uncharacterized protein
MRWGRIGLLVLCALGLAEGGSSAAGAQALPENKALVRRVFDDILNQGRYEVFEQFYDPAFVKHVGQHVENLAEEVRDAKAMRAGASDLVMTVDFMVAQEDLVAVLYTGRGTNDGPFRGMPPTGRKLVLSGMSLYRVSKGRIAEEWTFYDELDLLRQLGYADSTSPR